MIFGGLDMIPIAASMISMEAKKIKQRGRTGLAVELVLRDKAEKGLHLQRTGYRCQTGVKISKGKRTNLFRGWVVYGGDEAMDFVGLYVRTRQYQVTATSPTSGEKTRLRHLHQDFLSKLVVIMAYCPVHCKTNGT